MTTVEDCFLLKENREASTNPLFALFIITVSISCPGVDLAPDVKSFIDSGASFNGISIDLCVKLGLNIVDYPDNPLNVVLGANHSATKNPEVFKERVTDTVRVWIFVAFFF